MSRRITEISQAYREIPAMDQWLRRRVRMYYWKQWKRARNRRRQLVRLGIHPAEVSLLSTLNHQLSTIRSRHQPRPARAG
jgi:hypothetical protein